MIFAVTAGGGAVTMKKLIELDAAVSALDGLPMDYGRWDVDDVLHALASVPTVDAVPVRHGRWIHGQEVCREYIGITLIMEGA